MACEVRCVFAPEFPKNLQADVLDSISPFLGLLDRDLENLRIAFKGGDPEDLSDASIATLRRYHTATMWLDARFFALDLEERRRIIAHEFVHVLLAGFTSEVLGLFEGLAPKRFEGYVSARIEDAEERLTDVLGMVIYDALNSGKS